MPDVGHALKLLKILASGVVFVGIGVALIASGDRQAIVAGCGALLAGMVILGFIGLGIFGTPTDASPEKQSPASGNGTRLLWLGILLMLTPVLLYLYFQYGMDGQFLTVAVVFGMPGLVAGIVCVGAGVRSLAKARRLPAGRHEEISNLPQAGQDNSVAG